MITEYVKFKALETVTEEEVFLKADVINNFQKNMDGYIDAELVKGINDNDWCLIYHYENMEKLKAIGEKMRSCKIFDEFNPVVVQGSISVSFFRQLKKWN